jgi:origin recognition complex subunit 1
VQLWDSIRDPASPKTTATHAASLLAEHFTTPNPRRTCMVVLLDELDQLWTRKQDVLYVRVFFFKRFA